MRLSIALLFACATLLVTTACGADESQPQSTPTAEAAGPTAAPSATPAAGQLSDLALLYLDASRGPATDLYSAAYDGTAARKVASLPGGARVLDVRGRTAAVAAQTAISFIDLTSGATRPFTATNFVVAGRFVGDNTFIFTTSGGCAAGGRVQSSVYRLDVATLQQSELLSSMSNNVSITALDAAAGVLATTPLGCDVGVRSIALHNLADGRLLQSVDTPGCGWAAVAIALKKALVSLRSCNQPAERAGVDAVLYDYSGAAVAARDVRAPEGGSTQRPWLLRPGQPQAALATAQSGTPGPGSGSRSSGIWLLDLITLAFTNLAPGQGPEQWPLAWSADGRYLLVATVQAQGLCSYAYVDAVTRDLKPLAADITYCGTNGDVIGWTSLR